MKKIIVYIIAIVFMFSAITIAGQRGNRDNDKRGWNKKKQRTTQQYKKRQRNTRRYKKPQRNTRRYKKPQNTRTYRKKQTYKRGRSHYGNGYRDRYRGHNRSHTPRNYQGHWSSWSNWYIYYLLHHNEYRSHRYYRDSNGSLYFEFQDNTGTFAFSIGR